MVSEDSEQDVEEGNVVGGTTIRPEIFRGVRLSKTLFKLGRLWRRSPSHLPSRTRAELWSSSEACESIDIFLSHPWAAPGWQKYPALLFHFHSSSIANSIIPVLALGLVLDMAHLTPGGCPMQSSGFKVWEDGVAFNPWIGSLATVVGFVSLFLSPYVREGKGPLVFHDAVCINQTDDAMKRQGINSLAGFLAKSTELYILWTPEWYTRLWCVMELACYSATASQSDITFCPVFSTCTTFFGYAITTGFNLVRSFLACSLKYESIEQLVTWTSIVLLAIYAHMLRQKITRMAQLDWFMDNFEAKSAKCRDEDREFLMQTIRYWHGSEENFNNYVRGTLRERVTRSTQVADMAYCSSLTIAIPFGCFAACQVSAFIRAGISWDRTLSLAIVVLSDLFCLFPLALKLLVFLCKCASFTRSLNREGNAILRLSVVADWAVSFSIGAITCTSLGGVRILAVLLQRRIPFGGFLYAGPLCSLTLLACGSDQFVAWAQRE